MIPASFHAVFFTAFFMLSYSSLFFSSMFFSVVFCPIFHLFPVVIFFFFNDTATTEIYPLSLHDALPISGATWTPTWVRRWKSRCTRADGYSAGSVRLTWMAACASEAGRSIDGGAPRRGVPKGLPAPTPIARDRKSTRLNSSHT